MPYTKAISPVSNSYLTKGKEYEIVKSVLSTPRYGLWFKICDDKGEIRDCLQRECEHTDLKTWQLK